MNTVNYYYKENTRERETEKGRVEIAKLKEKEAL